MCSPVIVCMYHMGLWSCGCKINKLVKLSRDEFYEMYVLLYSFQWPHDEHTELAKDVVRFGHNVNNVRTFDFSVDVSASVWTVGEFYLNGLMR